jgi:hypothetical protein
LYFGPQVQSIEEVSKQRRERVIGKLFNRRLSRVWEKWLEFMDAMRGERERLELEQRIEEERQRTEQFKAVLEARKEAVIRRMKNRPLWETWNQWRETVAEEVREKKKAMEKRLLSMTTAFEQRRTRTLKRMVMGRLSQAWETWKAFIEMVKADREVLCVCTARLAGARCPLDDRCPLRARSAGCRRSLRGCARSTRARSSRSCVRARAWACERARASERAGACVRVSVGARARV